MVTTYSEHKNGRFLSHIPSLESIQHFTDVPLEPPQPPDRHQFGGPPSLGEIGGVFQLSPSSPQARESNTRSPRRGKEHARPKASEGEDRNKNQAEDLTVGDDPWRGTGDACTDLIIHPIPRRARANNILDEPSHPHPCIRQ